MARKVEPLDRGLVTIRDPALLKPGELSFIRNAVYTPSSQAIQRAKGRAAFGTATASALDVDGLRDITFDNGDHYVVAHVTASYVTAVVGDTGTFGVLANTVGDGSQLEAVQYRNRWFLFNGVANSATALPSNKVVYLSATAASTPPTVRQHGMKPVTQQPNVTAIATAFSQGVTGYYEYWTTEVAKFVQDTAEISIESAYSADPYTMYVTAVGMSPVISLQVPENGSFTNYWRVYRSPKKDKQSDKKFPIGFMIAEVSTAVTAIIDGGGTTTVSAFAGSFNSAQVFSDFGNAATMSADDNVYASATLTPGTIKAQGMYNFNFGGFAGQIKGIRVEFQASASGGNVQVVARIGRNRQPDGGFLPAGIANTPAAVRQIVGDLYQKQNTAAKSAVVTANSNPGQTITLGSSTDRWFEPNLAGFTDADFNPNFMLELYAYSFVGTPQLAIDYAKVYVDYGSTIDSVIQFPTVAYNFGDITSQVAKNGQPPSASTADVFEDTLVCNDVNNASTIKYSYPGDPEAFPSTYYLDFETTHNDRVTNIKTVNGRLVVMLRNSVYRVNYLPSERDASFDRGKATEAISRDFGCVNEMCACVFSVGGSRDMLAFVSDQGVMVTDGYTVKNWCDNLDWRGDRDGFGIANTGANYVPVALVNDVENLQIVFVFRNTAVGFGGDYYTLNFQHSDMVGGLPRVSGFVTMLNNSSGNTAAPKSAWPIVRSNGVTELWYGYGASAGGTQSTAAGAGQVWRETGTTIPSTNATMQYQTRRMYLAGMGMEWRLNELYGYAGLVGSAVTATYQTDNLKTNSDTNYTQSKSYAYSNTHLNKLHKVQFDQAAEGLRIAATVSGNANYAQEYLILDGESFGKEDAGT